MVHHWWGEGSISLARPPPHACTNITNPHIMICFLICYVMFIFLFFFILIIPVNFLFIIIIFFFPFFLFFSHTSCTIFPTNKPLHPQCRRSIILEYEGALYRIEEGEMSIDFSRKLHRGYYFHHVIDIPWSANRPAFPGTVQLLYVLCPSKKFSSLADLWRAIEVSGTPPQDRWRRRN